MARAGTHCIPASTRQQAASLAALIPRVMGALACVKYTRPQRAQRARLAGLSVQYAAQLQATVHKNFALQMHDKASDISAFQP